MNDIAKQKGLFASLRRLLGTVLEIAQVRVDLLGTEIELEKQRVFNGLLWGTCALLIFGVGVVLLCGFIILLFWEGYRLAAVGSMALIYLTGGILLMREARQRLSNPTGMFNASVAELERDRAEFQASGEHGQR